ncbi:MAG: STAS domain-containing protein [Deltaproteobacteria bacterium]|nr:STAS domain-containing protein [Deltaproteobacteria bacterium]
MLDVFKIPIIKLYDTLIVSIQMALTDQLVRQLKQDITMEIDRTDATGLIIDLSGMDVMDSYITKAIRDIGLVSRLMGVETVLCSLDPMIAITLVEMDLSPEGITTALNLEAALDYLRSKHVPGPEGTSQNKANV